MYDLIYAFILFVIFMYCNIQMCRKRKCKQNFPLHPSDVLYAGEGNMSQKAQFFT